MVKRSLAAIFWFVSMYALGSAIEYATGLGGGLIALTLAFVAGGIMAIDPLDVFRVRADRATHAGTLPAPARAHSI